MLNIAFEANEVVIKFPKQLVTSDYVQNFLERLRLETNLQKSTFSEEAGWELSEELKGDWWQKNKETFLKRGNA